MSLLALDALRERWVQWLRLDRMVDRPAAFESGQVTAGAPSMADEPDITVLIPAFQHERYISAALRSVLAQTYPRFRVLVVDDASTDQTVARARSVNDPRITITVNRQNLGLGPSLVSALADVQTPFVALLNSDDLFHPCRLELCREALLRAPELRVIATGMILVDARGRRLTSGSASRIVDGRRIFHWARWHAGSREAADPAEPIFLRLLRNNFLLTSSNAVCHTSYLREHVATLAELHYCLDWYVFLSAAAAEQLGYLDEALLAYRLHATNTVWFTPRTRPAYTAEVNRVAAEAVINYLSHVDGPAMDTRALEAASSLASNPDVDSRELFANELPRRLRLIPSAQAVEIAMRFTAPLREPVDARERA